MKNNIYSSYQKLAVFYDKAYGRKFYSKYAYFVNEIIKKNRIENPKILDLACGTGSLINELNKKFKYIEGVDASLEMLKIAKLKNPNNKFYHQTFQSLHLNKTYDIITCTFDSINYLLKERDLRRAFKNISQHLRNNGLFIFDFNTVYKKIDSKFNINNITFYNSIDNNYWNVKIQIIENNKVYTEKHKEKLLTIKILDTNLEKYYIRIIEMYSDFNKRTSKQSKAERLIVVARKLEN